MVPNQSLNTLVPAGADLSWAAAKFGNEQQGLLEMTSMASAATMSHGRVSAQVHVKEQ